MASLPPTTQRLVCGRQRRQQVYPIVSIIYKIDEYKTDEVTMSVRLHVFSCKHICQTCTGVYASQYKINIVN